jgi:hypothetical protein
MLRTDNSYILFKVIKIYYIKQMGLTCSNVSNKLEHCKTMVFPKWKYKINKFLHSKCYYHRSPKQDNKHLDENAVVIDIHEEITKSHFNSTEKNFDYGFVHIDLPVHPRLNSTLKVFNPIYL